MKKTTEMEINISEGRILECRINPLAFPMDAEWIQHEPKTKRQMKTKELFLNARAKDRLHAFTCMRIDPSIDPDTGKLVYRKGLPPAVGYSEKEWTKMLLNYDPSRNSRQMSRTEGICKRLLLIEKLVEEWKWEVDWAWYAVCDDSKKLGHYCNSDNPKNDFECTGSREVCGFYDLANAYKMLAEDPWEKASGFWAISGGYVSNSRDCPLIKAFHSNLVDIVGSYGLGELALD